MLADVFKPGLGREPFERVACTNPLNGWLARSHLEYLTGEPEPHWGRTRTRLLIAAPIRRGASGTPAATASPNSEAATTNARG